MLKGAVRALWGQPNKRPVSLLPFSLRNNSAGFVQAAGKELLIMFKLASRYRRDVEAATSAEETSFEDAQSSMLYGLATILWTDAERKSGKGHGLPSGMNPDSRLFWRESRDR